MSEVIKEKKLVNALESIPKFMTYSQYNKSLNRQFYQRNLKGLLAELKHPKHYKRITPLEIIISKYPYELYSKMTDNDKEEKEILPFITKNNLKSDDQYKKAETSNQNTNNNSMDKSKKRNKTFFRYQTKKNNTVMNDIDPFKYNPNYNAIYKNTQSFKIFEPTPRIIKNPENQNTKSIDNNYKNRTKLYLKKILNSENTKNKNSENAKTKNNYPLLTCISDKINNQTIINSCRDKNNHAMQFWQYTPRSDNILKVNDKVSYLEPYDILENQKKIVNFKKMLSRNEVEMSKNKNTTPSICYYNPNYNYLKEHIPKITIDSASISKESRTKKFALQKILRKYDIKKDYEIVDNSKLSDEIDVSL